MSGRVLTRLAPVVLVLAASLSACGSDEDTDPPATEQASSSSPSESPTDTPSDSGSGSDEEAESGDTDAVALTVTRTGDSFTPNGERVELGVGQPLQLTIEADEAGELHVHSTPEQDISYEAGTSEHEVVVDRPGVVEVESHDPDIILLQLEVR